MRRKLITIVAVVAAISALTTGAIAQESDEAVAGRLWAFGTGTATLKVDQGAVKLLAVGDITITGPAGLDVAINSWSGDEAPLARDGGDVTIELTGFAGGIAVRGSNYTVVVDGVTTLGGAGFGGATFEGDGLWKTRRSQGQWPATVGTTESDAA